MKIKSGFVVRSIGGKLVAVATGKTSREFHGMITLNETGKFLFDALQKNTTPEALAVLLTETYEVDVNTATAAVESFLQVLRKEGLLEE